MNPFKNGLLFHGNVCANGLELGFCHANGSLGIFLHMDKLSDIAMSGTSPFSKELLLCIEEFQALIFFKDFENSSLFKDIESKQPQTYSVKYLTKISQQAEMVLNSSQANDKKKKNALWFLDALDELQVNCDQNTHKNNQ